MLYSRLPNHVGSYYGITRTDKKKYICSVKKKCQIVDFFFFLECLLKKKRLKWTQHQKQFFMLYYMSSQRMDITLRHWIIYSNWQIKDCFKIKEAVYFYLAAIWMQTLFPPLFLHAVGVITLLEGWQRHNL